MNEPSKEEKDILEMSKAERDKHLFRHHMKRLREEKGWTQNQLATELCKAGLDSFKQITVARIEEGKRAVKLEEAGVIAQVLDSYVHYMLAMPVVLEYAEYLQDIIHKNFEAQKQISRAISEYIDARAAYHRVDTGESLLDIAEYRDYLSDEIIASYSRRLKFIATYPSASFESLLEEAMRTTIALGDKETGYESVTRFINELKNIDFQAVLERATKPPQDPFAYEQSESET